MHVKQTHHLLILSQDQVISAHGYAEDDGSDSLEAVDPLLPLGPLASNIKHSAGDKWCKLAGYRMRWGGGGGTKSNTLSH